MSYLRETVRECNSCGSTDTYIDKNGYAYWRQNRPFDQWLCQKCYDKFIHHPITHKKWNPIHHKRWNPIYGPRRLRFKNIRVLMDKNPRTGYCSLCSNNIFDGSCRRTHIHHIEYHDDDVLRNTIELCVSCHNEESLRLKKGVDN